MKKYLELNYGAKGKEVKSWIQSHTPDPWPEASIRGLNQLIMRLTTKLDNGKPEGYSLLKWRRKQVEKYLHRNPNAKGQAVKTWLQNHAIDPWPEVTITGLNRLLRRLKSTTNVYQQNEDLESSN